MWASLRQGVCDRASKVVRFHQRAIRAELSIRVIGNFIHNDTDELNLWPDDFRSGSPDSLRTSFSISTIALSSQT